MSIRGLLCEAQHSQSIKEEALSTEDFIDKGPNNMAFTKPIPHIQVSSIHWQTLGWLCWEEKPGIDMGTTRKKWQ